MYLINQLKGRDGMMKVYRAFPGGKHKVLTLSYDDGKTADYKLVEIMNKYGIRGTFNLNGGLQKDGKHIDSSEWKDLYKGHEVAAHTFTHPTIDRCPSQEVVSELLNDKIYLEDVMGYPIRGIAYPNGSYSTRIRDIAKSLGFVYGRAVGDSYAMVHATELSNRDAQGKVPVGDENGFSLPTDYMEWKATCHHKHGLMDFGKSFCELHKTQYLYMMYVWGHSYEFEQDGNWGLMDEFCSMMSDKDDIWYATNVEVVECMEVFERLQFAANMSFVYNPSAASAWLMVNNTPVEVKGGEKVDLSKFS
jgi:hypothetical protein